MIVCVILVVMAAFFSACADRVETPIHFNDSVFHNLKPRFYSKVDSSGANRIPFTNYPFNFWHICKSGMICSLLATSIFYSIMINRLVDYLCLGLIYNIVFEQFYSHILKLKK